MPHSSTLWMAAGLLWVLDTFGNVSMEPFRAFVTDKLPDSQVNRGFIMQSMMIGLGGSIASALPWLMKNVFKFTNTASQGTIPENVKWSFYIGSFFFLCSVLYTVFTTHEYPPSDPDYKKKRTDTESQAVSGVSEILHSLTHMPKRMRVVALVQFFTWPGLFLMWFYYTTAVAVNVFGGKDASDPVYATGADFGSLTLSYYSVVTFLFALVLPLIADRLGRKLTHSLCLLCGAIGLISVSWIHDRYLLYVSMTGIGIAWASILSMPYAMLSGSLPKDKVGIYMGIFNFFIVLPEIIASLGFGWLMKNVLHNSRLLAIEIGGYLFIAAALLCYFLVKEKKHEYENVEETATLEILEQKAI